MSFIFISFFMSS